MKLGEWPARRLFLGRPVAQHKQLEAGSTAYPSLFYEWLKRDQGQNRSHDEVKRLIEKNVLPAWGHRQITELGRRDVLDVIDAIVDRGSPITATRLHAHLHRLFKWSAGRGIIATNPMTDMPRPANAPKRDRVLSDDELAAVWNAAGKIGWPFGDATRLLILTGARREEIGQLEWTEIVADCIALDGARTKNGEPHLIPLSLPALTLLEQAPRFIDSVFVFTRSGSKAIVGARMKART